MARRITYRLLIFGSLIIMLVVLIVHSSSYGLTREAQYDSLRKKMGGAKDGAGSPEREKVAAVEEVVTNVSMEKECKGGEE